MGRRDMPTMSDGLVTAVMRRSNTVAAAAGTNPKVAIGASMAVPSSAAARMAHPVRDWWCIGHIA